MYLDTARSSSLNKHPWCGERQFFIYRTNLEAHAVMADISSNHRCHGYMLQPSQSPPAVVADATGSTRSLALGAVTQRAVVWARSTRATRSCGAIAPQGGDGNDERHLRQQLQQVSDLMRAAHTLLGDIVGVALPDLRPSQQRQQRRPSRYFY